MTQKKNVLLVNDFESGGGAESVFQMTRQLLNEDYNIFIYTAYQGFNNSGTNPLAYIFSRKHYKNIKNIVLQENIDIVHIQNFRWISPSVFYLKRWIKKNHSKQVCFVLTAHDYFLVCPNVAYGYYDKTKEFKRFSSTSIDNSFFFKQMDQHGWKFSWLKKIQWYLAFSILQLQKEIDVIISPSHFLEKILKLHFPNKSVFLIRNPIEHHYDGIQKINTNNKERILYMGRVASEKGTDKLLSQLSKIKEEIQFQLDIYGTGPMAKQIPDLIQKLGLSDNVFFFGYTPFKEIERKMPLYNSFIMSSIWYENAPLSIVESSLNGLNVIVPDMGGMKELAKLCENNFEYLLEDENSLLTALKNSQENKYDNAEIKKLKDIFSKERYLENLKNIYENITHR